MNRNVLPKPFWRIPEDGLEKWIELGEKYSAEWPNITERVDPMDGADAAKDEQDKFEKHFSDKPGAGT